MVGPMQGPDVKEIPPTGKSFDVDFFTRRSVQAVPAYATIASTEEAQSSLRRLSRARAR
jgi:hypothetical protein